MKYDCTKTRDCLHEYHRLCDSHEAGCESDCPFFEEYELCGFDIFESEDNIAALQKWSDEHPEPPKLTKEERAFLESFKITNGKYIYRDGNGRLWLTKDYEEIAELWGTMFPFITHDVENWWSVNELLCLKTE